MKKLLMVCAVAAMLAGTANATYTIEHPHSQGIGYANVSFNGGGSTVSSYLGRFIMEPIPSTELPPQYPIYSILTVDGPELGFYSYCIEPGQSIGVGHGASYEFSIGTLAGSDGVTAPEAALINELLGRYNSLLQNDPTLPTGYTGATFRTAAAALQLAIWKINLDAATETLGSWDFASGNMRVSTNLIRENASSSYADQIALGMLNSLTGSGPMALGLEGLRNATIQDLVIQVPEPITIAMLALGGLLIRRK